MILAKADGTEWRIEQANAKLTLRTKLPGARVFDLLALLVPEAVPLMPAAARSFALGEAAAQDAQAFVDVNPLRVAARSSQEAQHPCEQRCPDDRPHDREILVPDVQAEDLRQVKLSGDPHAQQRSDETERDGTEPTGAAVGR
jgi:hypothetical protein